MPLRGGRIGLLHGSIRPNPRDISEVKLSHTLAATSVAFDDPNLVSSAGLVPVLALADHRILDRHSTCPVGDRLTVVILRSKFSIFTGVGQRPETRLRRSAAMSSSTHRCSTRRGSFPAYEPAHPHQAADLRFEGFISAGSGRGSASAAEIRAATGVPARRRASRWRHNLRTAGVRGHLSGRSIPVVR